MQMDVVKDYFPTVIRVIPLNNFHVQVFFDDGKVVEYDATGDMKADIFTSLRDIKKFKKACTVMNGTLAWDISSKRDPFICIDIDPFTLYELDKNDDAMSGKEYNDKKMQEILTKAEDNVKNGRVAPIGEMFAELRSMLQEN